jgi:hypothetical protein
MVEGLILWVKWLNREKNGLFCEGVGSPEKKYSNLWLRGSFCGWSGWTEKKMVYSVKVLAHLKKNIPIYGWGAHFVGEVAKQRKKWFSLLK